VARGRWMGRSLLLEIDVTVPAELNLASAQDLARAAGTAALKAVPDARRVRCTPVAA
jgi:hypothetical protein